MRRLYPHWRGGSGIASSSATQQTTVRLPSVLAAGALASVRHLRSSNVERDGLQERAATVRRRLLDAGLPVMASENHIVPILDVEAFEEFAGYLAAPLGIANPIC
jgi:7-keto-8-aminopelargonate synthetase-like enzyme